MSLKQENGRLLFPIQNVIVVNSDKTLKVIERPGKMTRINPVSFKCLYITY